MGLNCNSHALSSAISIVVDVIPGDTESRYSPVQSGLLDLATSSDEDAGVRTEAGGRKAVLVDAAGSTVYEEYPRSEGRLGTTMAPTDDTLVPSIPVLGWRFLTHACAKSRCICARRFARSLAFFISCRLFVDDRVWPDFLQSVRNLLYACC